MWDRKREEREDEERMRKVSEREDMGVVMRGKKEEE